jgi:hypothetical protein
MRAAVMFIVMLLHVVGYWMASTTVNTTIQRKPPTFEWVIISPPRGTIPIRSSVSDLTVRPPTTVLAPTAPKPQAISPDESLRDQEADKQSTDWKAELELAAKHAIPDSAQKKQRDFGAPHHASPAAKAPSFDWDPVHTRRVEVMPEGGILVRLSDKCVMVFMPFPFAFCGIGKKEANGHLLDHMRDAPAADEP